MLTALPRWGNGWSIGQVKMKGVLRRWEELRDAVEGAQALSGVRSTASSHQPPNRGRPGPNRWDPAGRQGGPTARPRVPWVCGRRMKSVSRPAVPTRTSATAANCPSAPVPGCARRRLRRHDVQSDHRRRRPSQSMEA
jgi:hypothetical protein